jgi:DNA replication protein DnaC
MNRRMSEGCSICADNGMRIVERDGSRFAVECECRQAKRTQFLLHAAGIPERYQHCTLENFSTSGATSSKTLQSAAIFAKKFVEQYPFTNGSGLLFTGSIGVGKTHLATSILRNLIVDKGAKGVFRDYRELLKEIQSSYNKQSQITELEILEPVLECEILVLDELGAVKPTDWVWDTVSLVLNTRYNRKRTTIITTNFIDELPLRGEARVTSLKTQLREETLGDRIGQRMLSRLAEMCVTVTMQGEDYRRTIARARIG